MRRAPQRLPAFACLAALLGANILGTKVVWCGEDDKTTPKKAKQGSGLISDHRTNPDVLDWISVDAIVSDPDNRDGECIKISDVLDKAQNIDAQGFDFGKVRIVLVQMPHDPVARQRILDTNTEWRRDNVNFPDFVNEGVEYSCVGGNHLVTFLKMARQGMPCESFISVPPKNGGKPAMSLTMLQESDRDFGLAASKTVPCIVLKRAVRDIPGAISLIQSSENAGHTLLTVESDKQCMVRIAKATVKANYDKKITTTNLKTDFPHLTTHIDDYCAFVESLGGGTSPHWHHWKVCDARFTSGKCYLKGPLLKEISKLPGDVPWVKRACALAARSLPPGFLRDSGNAFVDWFTKSDINHVASDKEKLDAGNAALRDMEKYVNEKMKDKPDHEKMMFLARCDCRIARLLAKKTHSGFMGYKDTTEIFEELKFEITEFLRIGRKTARNATEKEAAIAKAKGSI